MQRGRIGGANRFRAGVAEQHALNRKHSAVVHARLRSLNALRKKPAPFR